MCLIFLLELFVIPINAMAKTSDETDYITLLIQKYMSFRYNLTDEVAEEWKGISVEGIFNDELRRVELIETHGIVNINSSYDIVNVEFSDPFIEVRILESVYYDDSVPKEIIHEITIMCDNNHDYIILSDSYREDYIDFISCSYIEEKKQDELNAIASTSCILYIAGQEIGYAETGDNITKYGEWYGLNGQPWCHMFVSWCANKAKISTSIIPKTASCDTGMNTFKNWGRFKYSKANGGSYTPKIGDIIYFGTKSDSTHVGIISMVSGSNITTIEGNANNQVRKKTYTLTNSSIVGYGTPKYATSQHSFSTYGTKFKCSNCGIIVSQIPSVSSIE